MSSKHSIEIICILLSVSCSVHANRRLDRTDVSEILQKLTSQSTNTWISAGTIEATHEEYKAPQITNSAEINSRINQEIRECQNNPNKRELTEELHKMKLDAIPFNIRYRLSNESKTNTTEVVKIDGERFSWEINVNNRTDSIRPGADLEGNFMTEEFNLNYNTKRIFVWDGEKYSIYALPINHTIVDSTGSTPHVVNGPLTAGIIPWGYGPYTYERLTSAEFSAEERESNGQTQINLTINTSDGSEISCVLDPSKDYAVSSCMLKQMDNSIIYQQYGSYQLISGRWIPTTISIERYDAQTNRLLSYDLWNFTKINDTAPAPDSFNVNFEHDALVEYRSFVTDKPLMYRYTNIADTELLLAEGLSFAASEGTQPQNCATAALGYAAMQLGKNVTNQQLAQLVSESDKTTSLYAMKRLTESLGLYCRAIKTDLQTLKNLHGCKVILHIPGKNHFVVLDHIDDQYVWIADLANNNFYYHTDINFFQMDWTEGTALLISNKPIQVQSSFANIADGQLYKMIGSAGYACSQLLQEYDVIFCSYAGGVCGGYYQEYFERWGCNYAPSGSCSYSKMLRFMASPCINDPYYPGHCTVTGEWTLYYMRACY